MAFDQLVALHQDAVYSLARGILGSREDAADVQQETFIRAWRSLHRFRGDVRFSTWLHSITVNLCLSHKRRCGLEATQDWIDESLPDRSTSSPVASVERTETITALKELLDATGAVSIESNGVLHISTVDSGMLWQLERELAELTARLGAEKQSKTEGHPDVKAIQGSIKQIEDRIKEEKRQQQSRLSAAGSQTRPSAPKGTVVAVVKLKYADPGLVAEQAFDLGLYKVVTSAGRKLILMGSPGIVREAKSLIAQLDDASSQSRSVRLSIVAKATRTRPDGRSVDSTLSTRTSGVFGGRWSSHIDLQDSPINLSLELFSATPSTDGRIITISGKGRLIYSNPPGMPMDMPMLFETSLQNGVPKSIGSTTMDSDGYATRADVTVTATIDPLRLQRATAFGRARR